MSKLSKSKVKPKSKSSSKSKAATKPNAERKVKSNLKSKVAANPAFDVKNITKSNKSTKKPTLFRRIVGWPAQAFKRTKARIGHFLQRRPHRSFVLTKRRDYKRPLRLPGYFAFTIEVTQTLWRKKWLFFRLMLTFFVLIILFGLMGRQDIYDHMRSVLNESAPESIFSGASGEIGKAGVILLTSVTSGLNVKLDSGQIIIAFLLGLYTWLTVVWLLRKIVAGRHVILRDGLYNAGAPILPTLLVLLILLIQMVPGAMAVLVISSAWQSGLIEGGAFSMLASISLALVALLSLYWMVSTFIALVVITLPGMYPMRAIAISGDLVIGRRLRLVYRMIWMMLVVISWWVVTMIPVILFDGWIKSVFEQIEWLPIVPVCMLILSIITITWVCTYIYMIYRKVVDDGSAPAL